MIRHYTRRGCWRLPVRAPHCSLEARARRVLHAAHEHPERGGERPRRGGDSLGDRGRTPVGQSIENRGLSEQPACQRGGQHRRLEHRGRRPHGSGLGVSPKSLFPSYQVLDLPFLFRDFATVSRVLDGPLGSELFAQLDTKGMIGLGWAANASREFETTTKPVRVPEDMRGQRSRILGGVVQTAMFQALGAIPVVFDNSEVYLGLQQHALDAVDVPLDPFTSMKFYTVCRHVAMTNHVFPILPILGSKREDRGAPAGALQRIIKDEGKAVVPYVRAAAAKTRNRCDRELAQQRRNLHRGAVPGVSQSDGSGLRIAPSQAWRRFDRPDRPRRQCRNKKLGARRTFVRRAPSVWFRARSRYFATASTSLVVTALALLPHELRM